MLVLAPAILSALGLTVMLSVMLANVASAVRENTREVRRLHELIERKARP